MVKKRMLVLVGLGVLLLVSISATMAAPLNAPFLQSTTETEPNNTFDEADLIFAPGYVVGEVSQDPDRPLDEVIDVDFFVMDTIVGRQYQASLTINSPQDLRVRMVLYDGDRGYMKSSSSSATNTSMSWTSNKASHYIKVEPVPVTSTLQTASYRLDVDLVAETPTATDTATPTKTPVSASDADEYEPNNSLEEAYILPVATAVTLGNLNFYPYPGRSGPDEDWFAFYVKDGHWYRAKTGDLSGADTYVEIVRTDHSVVASNDDSGSGYASQVDWEASYSGYYYVRVLNQVGTTGSYDLSIEEISSPATATPSGPAPTNPSADRCDERENGNYDFDHACVISPNVPEKFNFSPPPYGGPDNDFFKIWIKPGLHYECATSNLSAGVDPNMIIYDDNQNAIAGNDDVEPGNFNSRIAYYATYEGWLYVLVGYGDRDPPNLSDSNYTLTCNLKTPGEPTETSTPTGEATATPSPSPNGKTATPTPAASSVATPTPAESLTVRPLTTPTPKPATTPAPRLVPIRLLVYYDANNDRQPGAGEGIAGISAQAYEIATNQLLAQGFTDEQGNLEFTVKGPARLSVPFFGFSQLVASEEGASIYLRVPPQALPEGEP